jgi:hypothetical protein
MIDFNTNGHTILHRRSDNTKRWLSIEMHEQLHSVTIEKGAN